MVVEARVLQSYAHSNPGVDPALSSARCSSTNTRSSGSSRAAYDRRKLLVAHWVIRDGHVLETAAREQGSVHRMTLGAYDDHHELEGERLVMDSDEFDLRLYYDTES